MESFWESLMGCDKYINIYDDDDDDDDDDD